MSKRPLQIALALPACLLAAGEVGMLFAALFGTHPRWPQETLNLSEAAAVRDSADVVRLIEEGHDINARRTIPPGVMGSNAHELTPLEAAVANRRPELVALLVGRGARPEAATWAALWCGAVAGGNGGVIAALASARPATEAIVDCDAVAQ